MNARPEGPAIETATLSDRGAVRPHNEDHCGQAELGAGAVLVAVADGVSGQRGGGEASRLAIETLIEAYRALPVEMSPGKRLARAFQRANEAVYERALFVPELRGMATTLTAVVVERGQLHAAHVGDSRLYLVRADTIAQLTKDHTVAARRRRRPRAPLDLRNDASAWDLNRSLLTRSLGRELIAAIDRLDTRLRQDDRLVICTDGLYNTLADHELAALVGDRAAAGACRALIDGANARGARDNVSAAVVRMTGETADAGRKGFGNRMLRLLTRRP